MRPITIATFAAVVLAYSVPAGLAAQASSPTPKGAALGKVSGSCTFDKTHTVKFVDGVALQGNLFFGVKKPATLVRVSNLMLGGFRPDLFLDPEAELDGMSSGPKNAYNIIPLHRQDRRFGRPRALRIFAPRRLDLHRRYREKRSRQRHGQRNRRRHWW